MKRRIVFFALASLTLVLGCGDGSGDSTSSTAEEKIEYPQGPTREFFVPGGDNLIQTYGREASTAEREQASRVIEAWMQARAASAWREVCRYSDRATIAYAIRSAVSITQREFNECPSAMRVLFARTERLPENTMTGPIDSLRVGGGRGYAQYHGRGGIDWIVPVTRQDGGWAVATFDPVDRLK